MLQSSAWRASHAERNMHCASICAAEKVRGGRVSTTSLQCYLPTDLCMPRADATQTGVSDDSAVERPEVLGFHPGAPYYLEQR